MKTDLAGKKVLVLGGGLSGIGAAKLLCLAGAKPIIYDAGEKLTAADLSEKLPEEFRARVEIRCGGMNEAMLAAMFTGVELVIISPGIPLTVQPAQWAKEREIPVWGELELGYYCSSGRRARLAAITGTNGKTTTTTLVGEIMKAYYPRVYVVGNIGRPYTEIAGEAPEDAAVVAEVSSFQLETTQTFAPGVSAILNITPDHLDRHKTMACYVEMKEKVAENQTAEDVCVLNYENSHTRDFGGRCPARVIWFSSRRTLADGYFLADKEIIQAEGGVCRPLMRVDEMQLAGTCNVENVMAAIAVCRSMDVPMPVIIAAVKAFKAVPHRIEYVAARGGVDYYNDSKGTNPDAAIQAIEAMNKPTVLLAGGYDKGSEYDEWLAACAGKVKTLILMGATKHKIETCARAHGINTVFLTETFEEALELATNQARPGDAVLLSPACASWGMFPDYEVRGNCFKEYVLAL